MTSMAAPPSPPPPSPPPQRMSYPLGDPPSYPPPTYHEAIVQALPHGERSTSPHLATCHPTSVLGVPSPGPVTAMASPFVIAKTPAKGRVLTLRDAVCLVVEQGLTPDMALRACNSPDISNTALSRELSKVIYERATEVVARHGQEDEHDTNVAETSNNELEQEVTDSSFSAKKRQRTDTGTIGSGFAATGGITSSHAHSFSAPYLKGNMTHFQRKVHTKAKQLMEGEPQSTSQLPTLTPLAIGISGPTQALPPPDELEQFLHGTSERYTLAFREATQIFADLKAGKLENRKRLTQQQYLDALNRKWSLDGKDCGRDESREKYVLKLATVRRSVRAGNIGVGPLKKGKKLGSTVTQKSKTAKEEQKCSEIDPATVTTEVDPPTKADSTNNYLENPQDTVARYNQAFSEATQLFADLKRGKIDNALTQQQYIDHFNRKWSLDGQGKGASREKYVLNKSTINRALRKGYVGVGPMKKGKRSDAGCEVARQVALTRAHYPDERDGLAGDLEVEGYMLASIAGMMNETQFNNTH